MTSSVTWGAGIFQDDLASGFVGDIAQAPDLSLLRVALSRAGQAVGHLLYEPAIYALIAAEVLASVGGRPPKILPPELARWVADHREDRVPPALWPMAADAVERVKQDSELSELWARSDAEGKWLSKVDDLLERLKAASA
ncbi:MAG TPA: DUF4259 domain-containing protein [Reyranella sp.]|nr:DUF4259 domain-containing protein [Reyranella sp.]